MKREGCTEEVSLQLRSIDTKQAYSAPTMAGLNKMPRENERSRREGRYLCVGGMGGGKNISERGDNMG